MVNSTGNSTVDSSLDSTFGPSRGKPLAPATMSGNNIDFGAILQALIAPTANPQDASKAIGPETTTQLNKAGMGGYDPAAQINNNPYHEGAMKALKKMGEKDVVDGVAQGVPVEHILQNLAGMSVMGQQGQQMQQPGQMQQPSSGAQQPMQNDPRQALVGLLSGMAAMGQQEPQGIQQQATNIMNPQGKNLFGGLLDVLGNMTGINAADTAIKSVKLSNLSKLQKIKGEEPLQEGEREKQNILQDTERMKAIIASRADIAKEDKKNNFEQIKNIINEPVLSGDAASLKTLATQGWEASSNILAGMDKFGDDYIKQLSTPNSYEGQKLATFGNMLLEANARIKGGATLSNNEMEFAKAITTPTGRKAVFTNTKYARELTESSIRKFKNIIKDMDPHFDNRGAYKKARKANYSNEEIVDYFKKNGIIQ